MWEERILGLEQFHHSTSKGWGYKNFCPQNTENLIEGFRVIGYCNYRHVKT